MSLAGDLYSVLSGENIEGKQDNIASSKDVVFHSAQQAYIVDELWHDLTIPTSVEGDNEVAHPSVLYIPESFNGYKFWMAITPLPGGTSEPDENPEIFASNNGVDWVVPSGLSNPIAPDPDPTNDNFHNADTCLVLSPDRNTLICIWLESVDGVSTIKQLRSTNGIGWEPGNDLLSTIEASEGLLSPQLNWDKQNNRWVLHVVDHQSVNNVINYAFSTDKSLSSEFGARSNASYTLPDGLSDVWHIDIRILNSGKWFGLAMLDPNGGAGPTYPIESDNGIDWTFGPSLSQRLAYKSSYVPISESSALMYWGFRGSPDWHLELVKLKFNRFLEMDRQATFEANAASGAAAKIGRYYFEDSFARADNADNLGTSDSGESWVAETGEWNIVSNKAKCPISQNNIATVDVGYSDAEVIAYFEDLDNSFLHVVLRFSSTSQFHRLRVNNDQLVFQRVGGSGTANIRSISLPDTTSKVIRAVCVGTRYFIYSDGLLAIVVDDESHKTNTKFGIQGDQTDYTVDRFIVSKLQTN